MKWINIKDRLPNLGNRVLTYDAVNMYRVLDAQFVRICKEVTHWIYLEKPEKINGKNRCEG